MFTDIFPCCDGDFTAKILLTLQGVRQLEGVEHFEAAFYSLS